MENTIRTVIRKRYHVEIGKITLMGGGFYARVFFVELPCEPGKIVLKLYLMPGLSLNEYRQIAVLSKSARLKMPKLYWMETTQENVKYEVLAMEYLSGSNAGAIVVDNLRQHRTIASAAGWRVFSPIRTVWKTGNTPSIPLFSKLSAEEKSLATGSCRSVRCCLNRTMQKSYCRRGC